MEVEHRIRIRATPDVIFRIYEDVEHWHLWDPDTKQATLDGALRVGARGTLVPTRGRAVPMRVTEVTPGRSFTVESSLPLFRMVFEHVLVPSAAGTEVRHRVVFSGLLSLVLGPMLKRRLKVGLPVTLDGLRRIAEGDRVA